MFYVKFGFNLIWIDLFLEGMKFDFGLRIECFDGGCNGFFCSIDIFGNSFIIKGLIVDIGVGGVSFCVVIVLKGSSVYIVVYSVDGGDGGFDDFFLEEEKFKFSFKFKFKFKFSFKFEFELVVEEIIFKELEFELMSIYMFFLLELIIIEEFEIIEELIISEEFIIFFIKKDRLLYKFGIFCENGMDLMLMFVEKLIFISKFMELIDEVEEKFEIKDEDNKVGCKGGSVLFVGFVIVFVVVVCFF